MQLLKELPHYWLRPLWAAGAQADLLSLQERGWCERLPASSGPRYAASRSLLRQLLAGLWAMPPQRVPLDSPPGQPPQMAPGFGHVSLSHSGDQLLLAWSPQPIGVDLEWAQRPVLASALARRFFPAQESARLLALKPQDQRRALLESWVRKEAAVKWQGSSLAQQLRHWLWDAQQQRLVHLELGLQPPVLCHERNGWLCAAVGEGVLEGIWG